MIPRPFPPAARKQRGIALFLCIFALLLASAIGFGMIVMADTETVVGSNYRDTQVAFFAARAGLEEARARVAGGTNAITPPAGAPSTSTANIIYITNPRNTETVNPTSTSSTFSSNYFDDELCQENAFTSISGTIGVPCTAVPSGSAWYSTTASKEPYVGANGALFYKWVRIQQKTNALTPNLVDTTKGNQALVCWDSVNLHEIATASSSCTGQYLPVYVLTSLAVTSGGYTVANGGSRRMLQMEVYIQPAAASYPYAAFATGTGCGAMTFSGNVTSDSFNSNNGTYAATHTNSGGNVGTEGSLLASGSPGVTIDGTFYSPLPASMGACPANSYNWSGSGTISGGASVLTATYTPPAVPAPKYSTSSSSQVFAQNGCSAFPTGCTGSGGNITLQPGGYNAIITSGTNTINLVAGEYDIYSVTASGTFTFNVTSGPVIINFTSPSSPVTSSGAWLANSSGVPSNLTVYYNGTGSLPLSGSSSSYAIIDAPNAGVVVSGSNSWYGAVVGNTVTASGGAQFHYDQALSSSGGSSKVGPVNIAFRELMY